MCFHTLLYLMPPTDLWGWQAVKFPSVKMKNPRLRQVMSCPNHHCWEVGKPWLESRPFDCLVNILSTVPCHFLWFSGVNSVCAFHLIYEIWPISTSLDMSSPKLTNLSTDRLPDILTAVFIICPLDVSTHVQWPSLLSLTSVSLFIYCLVDGLQHLKATIHFADFEVNVTTVRCLLDTQILRQLLCLPWNLQSIPPSLNLLLPTCRTVTWLQKVRTPSRPFLKADSLFFKVP